MSDPLTDFNAAINALYEAYDAEPAWAIAVYKERGVIPQDANWVCAVHGPNGYCALHYAFDRPSEGGEWILAGRVK